MRLEAWHKRFARKPLLFAMAAIICVQLIFIGALLLFNDRSAREFLKSMRISASIALSQKNRQMLESFVGTASANKEIGEFSLCLGEAPIVSTNLKSELCTRNSWTVLMTEIPGFDGYTIRINRTFSGASLLGLFSILATVLLSLASLGLIGRLRQRFQSDIFDPLRTDFRVAPREPIEEFEALQSRHRQLIKLESARAEGEIAKQVAHDIRSPLSALNIFIGSRGQKLGQTDLEFVTQINERIQRIADSLLERSRRFSRRMMNSAMVFDLTRQIVREKLTAKPKLQIELACEMESEINVDFAADDWTRILSNILNNAIEASDHEAVIQLRLFTSKSGLELSCVDCGRGIPVDVLAKILSEGGSHGKAGNGLGLKHLRETVSAAEGRFDIQSQPGVGTRVEIFLPAAQEP